MSKDSNHELNYKIKWVVGLLSIAVLLFVCVYSIWLNEGLPVVTIRVENASIFQEEETPEITVYAACSQKDNDLVLNESNGYRLEQLLRDLERGVGYELEYDIDAAKEGTYPIKILLNDSLKGKFTSEWRHKIRYVIENGTLEVKNKYGEWENEKFKKRDGSYAENEFITSKGHTYYLDETGERAIGWQTIADAKYYFNKKGIMTTGFAEIKEDTYYFYEDGKMATGWVNIGEDTYCFDAEGKMQTGEQTYHDVVYYFRKDGKLDTEKNKINPNRPMIALTFDDGPGKYTDALLDKLEEYGGRATFFMLGGNVSKYPDTLKKMQEIGCEIGNHTTNHKNLTKLEPEERNSQIETTSQLVKEITGQGTTLLRPPYGSVNAEVRASVNYPLIMWSLDTTDWQRKNAESIAKYVLETVQDGDIVLMHDIHDFSVEAMMTLIPELTDRGYQLVTVSEMAEARGTKLENGVKYFKFVE